MTNVKHHDFVKSIAKDEEYHCVAFPEEYRFWSKKNPWDLKKLKNSGLTMVSARVVSSKPIGATNTQRFTKNQPLKIKSGIEITSGSFSTTTQNLRGAFLVRADSFVEFSAILNELSSMFELDQWEIQQLTLYNPKSGAELEYKIHNPDGTGAKLYFWRVQIPDSTRLYNLVPIFEQQTLCNNFYDSFAACKLVSDLKPMCAVKARRSGGKQNV